MVTDTDHTGRFTALIFMPIWIHETNHTSLITAEERSRFETDCGDKYDHFKKMINYAKRSTQDVSLRDLMGMSGSSTTKTDAKSDDRNQTDFQGMRTHRTGRN